MNYKLKSLLNYIEETADEIHGLGVEIEEHVHDLIDDITMKWYEENKGKYVVWGVKQYEFFCTTYNQTRFDLVLYVNEKLDCSISNHVYTTDDIEEGIARLHRARNDHGLCMGDLRLLRLSEVHDILDIRNLVKIDKHSPLITAVNDAKDHPWLNL